MNTANARPKPISFSTRRSESTKLPNTQIMIAAAAVMSRAVFARPCATARGVVAVRSYSSLMRRQQEHLVVHREPEHDGEEHHRDPRLDRPFLADAHRALHPTPLEDRDDHAVGGADRQQVHDHGLQRHEQRSEHEHQQDEAQQQDRDEHVRQAPAQRVGEVDADRGLARPRTCGDRCPRWRPGSRRRGGGARARSCSGPAASPSPRPGSTRPCRWGSESPGSRVGTSGSAAIALRSRLGGRRGRPAVESRRHQQRAVEAGPESLRQQVVGAPRRELGRIVAGVGNAEPQREERARPAREGSARPPIAAGHGCAWIARLQRVQMLLSTLRFFFAPGNANLSIVWPTKPSTAGSSVTAAAITNSTASDAPTARPRMNDTPITNRPSSEITTVLPGEQHGAPAGVDRVHDRTLGIHTFVQRLSIARADEQRVVDADADPDHRGDLRRERRDVHAPVRAT